MSEDKFLKVMLFGSPIRRVLMKRPLLGYALVGYSLGFWGYMTYSQFKEYFRLEREANERHQRYRDSWTRNNKEEFRKMMERLNAELQSNLEF